MTEQGAITRAVDGVTEEAARSVVRSLAELLEISDGHGDASVRGWRPAEITMSEVGQTLGQRRVVVPEVVREVQSSGDGSEQVVVV